MRSSNCDGYEISDAVDPLIHSGQTIDASGMNKWCNDIRYIVDRDKPEWRSQGELIRN